MNKVQELLVPQTIKATYKPAYNLTGSYSIKKANENDYQEWLVYLAYNKISKGDYIVEAYRELDKANITTRLRNLLGYNGYLLGDLGSYLNKIGLGKLGSLLYAHDAARTTNLGPFKLM